MIYSQEYQCISLVLAALTTLKGVKTKQQTIRFIERSRWFAIKPEHLDPYSSHEDGNREPRWHTLLAFAKQHCADRGFVGNHYDQWEITAVGAERFTKVRQKFEHGIFDVTKCFLWSMEFKKFMCPTYEASDRDWTGPESELDQYE